MHTPSAHNHKRIYVWSAHFPMQMDWTKPALETEAHHSPYFLHSRRSIFCFQETNKAQFFIIIWHENAYSPICIFRAFWGKKRNEQNRHKTATNIRVEWLNYYAITKTTATTTFKRSSLLPLHTTMRCNRREPKKAIRFIFLHKRFFPSFHMCMDGGFFFNFSSTKLTTTIDVI